MTRDTLLARIRLKGARQPNGCVVWTGMVDRGCPRIRWQGRRRNVATLLYEIETGQTLPQGMTTLRLCPTELCIEVSHHGVCTQREAMQYLEKVGRHHGTRPVAAPTPERQASRLHNRERRKANPEYWDNWNRTHTDWIKESHLRRSKTRDKEAAKLALYKWRGTPNGRAALKRMRQKFYAKNSVRINAARRAKRAALKSVLSPTQETISA